MTPNYYSANHASLFYIFGRGLSSAGTADTTYEVKPAISLRSGIKYTKGDGTATLDLLCSALPEGIKYTKGDGTATSPYRIDMSS